MSSNKSRMGFAIIVNNRHFMRSSEREGSEMDVENLRRSLTRLNFDIEVFSNSNATKMASLMSQYATTKNYSGYDCFVCVLMSHGGSKQVTRINKQEKKKLQISS
jgi:hypothetical protein